MTPRNRIILLALLLLSCATTLHAQDDFWRPLDEPYGGNIYYFVQAANGDLYTSSGWAGIVRSRDEGATWQPLRTSSTTSGTPVLVTRSGSIFIISEQDGELYRSDDDGGSWTPVSDGLSGISPGFMAETPGGTLVMATNRGIYRSTSNGATWSKSSLDSLEFRFPSVAPDSTIYAASANAGLFRSTDDGVTWAAVGEMQQNPIDAFLYLPAGRMLVGTDQWNLWLRQQR